VTAEQTSRIDASELRVLVCIKRVPAPGARINLTDDGQRIDTAHLGFAMSPHEECAVEAAIQLTQEAGGEATVLTVGPEEAEEQLRYAVSLGIHKAVLVKTDGEAVNPQRTARAIGAAVAALEAADGPFHLILFGNESADSGGFQVGIRVAVGLGRPIVTAIKGIDLELEAPAITAKREIDGGLEIYKLPTPAVLGVKEGLNLPRYPTMKGRLASKKAEITQFQPGESEPDGLDGQTSLGLIQPPQKASNVVRLGEGPAAAPAVVDLLDELGVL